MCQRILEKLQNNKFNENQISCSLVLTSGQTDAMKMAGAILQLRCERV
jgi:hypothetical protein